MSLRDPDAGLPGRRRQEVEREDHVTHTLGWRVALVAVLTPVLDADAATGPRISATGGTSQSTAVNTAFAHSLSARVVGEKGHPRAGLLATFRGPTSGPSLRTANGRTSRTHRTGKHGYVRVTATANGIKGSYKVVAGLHSTPVRTATFSLTNTPWGDRRIGGLPAAD